MLCSAGMQPGKGGPGKGGPPGPPGGKGSPPPAGKGKEQPFFLPQNGDKFFGLIILPKNISVFFSALGTQSHSLPEFFSTDYFNVLVSTKDGWQR
jgi:hypothetical protein